MSKWRGRMFDRISVSTALNKSSCDIELERLGEEVVLRYCIDKYKTRLRIIKSVSEVNFSKIAVSSGSVDRYRTNTGIASIDNAKWYNDGNKYLALYENTEDLGMTLRHKDDEKSFIICVAEVKVIVKFDNSNPELPRITECEVFVKEECVGKIA